jgi:NitT/TauT family transport system permease protein
MVPEKSSTGSSWFAVWENLSSGKRSILTAASFLLPLLLWVVVSYVPWIWHPDMKLTVSADRNDVTTVFIAGDRVSKEFFPTFVEAIEEENARILEAREAGEPSGNSRRDNIKKLRKIAPIGIANGWLELGEEQEDEKIFGIWKGLSTGTLQSDKLRLSEANLSVIKSNWDSLSAVMETYDSKLVPKESLLKLIPQGVASNPVYVPAPHEVIQAGWHDFTAEPENDMPTMWERYRHSLSIIFWGFAYSCMLAIPLAVLCGTFDFFSKLHEPFVDFFRYMPAPTFSVIFVAFLGTADAPKITLVFVGTFFQMVLVIANTTRMLEKPLLEAAQTLGANRRQLLGRVIVPGILPNLFNDLRILLGWAWTWLVIAELIGEKTGLTGFIDTQGTRYNFDRVFPVIILIGITGFFTDQFLNWLRNLLFPWTEEAQRSKKNFITKAILWLFDTSCYVKDTKLEVKS